MTKRSVTIASCLFLSASGCGSVEVLPNPGSSSSSGGAGGGGSSSTTSTSTTTSSAGGGGAGGAGCIDPAWTMAPFRPTFEPRRFPVFVWTGQACIWSGSLDLLGEELPVDGGACYDRVSGLWKDLSKENDPWSRSCASAAWSGSEIVVWGGSKSIYSPYWGDQAGGRYSPGSDTWTPTSVEGAPSARRTQGGVWDGTGLLVWGGMEVPENVAPAVFVGDGGRYDPVKDAWTPLGSVGAPAPRAAPVAFWTGSRMLVWGGQGTFTSAFSDGALYDPSSDTWAPMSAEGAPSPRTRFGAAFGGGQLLLYGGTLPDDVHSTLADGYLYDVASDTWRTLPSCPLGARRNIAAAWTGKRFVLWGGDKGIGLEDFATDGAFYDPQTSTWTPTPACGPRGGLTSAITGPDGAVLYNGDWSELWFLDDP